jgi:hypothetical protein
MTNITTSQREIFDASYEGTYKMVLSLLTQCNWTSDQAKEEIKTKLQQANVFFEKGMIDLGYKFLGAYHGLIKALREFNPGCSI